MTVDEDLKAKLRRMCDYMRAPCPFQPGDFVRVALDKHGNAAKQAEDDFGVSIVVNVAPEQTYSGGWVDVEILHFDEDDNAFRLWKIEGWRLEAA